MGDDGNGHRFAARYLDRIDGILTSLAARLINSTASRRKVSAHHLALAVPGVCHGHAPDARLHDECAYCRRRGNCFATAQQEEDE